mgnify:CR=1 FL=1
MRFPTEKELAKTALGMIGILAVTALLFGCAIPRSFYEINYTFVTPTTSTRDEVVTGKVGGDGLTHSRVLVEFPRAFKLLMEQLRGKK